MMRNYAIFDLDGTLVDSMGVWRNIGSDFLIAKGITPPEELREQIKTMTMMESATYLRVKLGVDLKEEEIISQINEMVIDKYANEVSLKSGVKRYIKYLRHKGIKICVLTAAERVCVEAVLKNHEIIEDFEVILTCTEIGLSKMDSEIFRVAAKKLAQQEVKMEEVMVFEDALHAIQMAKEAGCYVVGVADEAAEKDRVKIESICDQYIQSFEEMEYL